MGSVAKDNDNFYRVVIFSFSDEPNIRMFSRFATLSGARKYLTLCFERIMRKDPQDHSMFRLYNLLGWKKVI